VRGFVDNIILRKLTTVGGASVSISSDGSWSIDHVDEVVKGSFHHRLMYDRGPEMGGQYGQRIVAVARLPLSVNVSQGDQIVISGKHASIDGVYEINAVMVTPTHQRAEVRKISV